MNGKELDFVRPMFDEIAPKYDFLNRLLSLRQDVIWRRKLVRALNIPDAGRILDVACGTGDVVLEVCAQRKTVLACGLDFSSSMLGIARTKAAGPDLQAKKRAVFLAGNGLELPFSDDCFDALTIAFGIRNIVNRQAALEEFYRVLRPGGRIGILELATPGPGFVRTLYLFYFTRLLPAIGRLFSRHGHAYRYLPESVLRFPRPPVFAAMIADAGFSGVKYMPLTFGIATLYTGKKSSMAYNGFQKR